SGAVHFSFTKFSTSSSDLTLQGSALVSSKGSLKKNPSKKGKPVDHSVGRALYRSPIHIWDETTGKVASFDATFSFVSEAPAIPMLFPSSKGELNDEDDTRIGGQLGVVNDSYNVIRVTVAVENDGYRNRVDPSARPHISLPIKSVRSKKTAKWNMQTGKVGTAHISYNSVAKRLSAVVSYTGNSSSTTVSYDVLLNLAVLPSKVLVGKTATGLYKDHVETNTILSWSFTSKLKTNSIAD
uniref:Lactose-binding lectin-2 n=1 Tax=Cymbosema roseum TaxID=202239 RepID=LEC2_CYMRO|nr:RecName: Full=Lactose-binding lectin-2; AltName: Full=Lectin-II; Short=CRLII [Cymbosema roseum]